MFFFLKNTRFRQITDVFDIPKFLGAVREYLNTPGVFLKNNARITTKRRGKFFTARNFNKRQLFRTPAGALGFLLFFTLISTWKIIGALNISTMTVRGYLISSLVTDILGIW